MQRHLAFYKVPKQSDNAPLKCYHRTQHSDTARTCTQSQNTNHWATMPPTVNNKLKFNLSLTYFIYCAYMGK